MIRNMLETILKTNMKTLCAQDKKKEIGDKKHLFTKCEKLADIELMRYNKQP